MAEIGLFEAMYTARALRRFKPDPVPDEIMTKVLDAAIRAPSGSNAQSWLFVVVKDAEKRRQLGAIYHKASQILTKLYAERPRASHFTEEQYRRFMSSVTYLFDHMHEAPVLLLACLKSARDGESGTHAGREHLSRRAEHHPGVPRLRSGHRADHDPRLFRGGDESGRRAAARGIDFCADADRLSARQVRARASSAGKRGHLPRQLRKALAWLAARRRIEA
jgi:nitroreductase